MPVSQTENDRIHNDLYNKVNECTSAVRALKTEVHTLRAAMRAETDRYVELLHKAQDRQFKVAGGLVLVVIFCIGIIGYGAIGKQGMYTVRDTIPVNRSTSVQDNPFIPTSDRYGQAYKAPVQKK